MPRDANRPDPRGLPAYRIGEAARYVRVPKSTVRWWVAGRDHYGRLFEPASKQPLVLSFFNLVELHILAAIRRQHRVPLPKVRSAVDFLSKEFGTDHPLLSHQLQTDGLDLFMEHSGKLLNISRDGQLAMRAVLKSALQRVERDAKGVPVRLFPFTRASMDDGPHVIVIDPRISGGRTVIARMGVATEVIADRLKAGESMEDLAEDYGLTDTEIEEAVRCELQAVA